MDHPRVIAVSSGKGGVGKTVVALNLAVSLAHRGSRVLLLDGDFGLGGLAIMAGLDPQHTVEEALRGRCALGDALLEGPGGIRLLPAASDGDTGVWRSAAIAPAAADEMRRLVAEHDCLLIDTAAGIGPASVDLASAAQEALLITTPEPTAIADAYATLKVLLSRNPELHAGLLVNMAESEDEAADVQDKFAQISTRFLGAQIDNRGYIPLDRYVREAVRRQVPFVLSSPPTPAAEAVAETVRLLLQRGASGAAGSEDFLCRALRLRDGSPYSG